jgi:hypothetical protein
MARFKRSRFRVTVGKGGKKSAQRERSRWQTQRENKTAGLSGHSACLVETLVAQQFQPVFVLLPR